MQETTWETKDVCWSVIIKWIIKVKVKVHPITGPEGPRGGVEV
jgi:hypothetical protein